MNELSWIMHEGFRATRRRVIFHQQTRLGGWLVGLNQQEHAAYNASLHNTMQLSECKRMRC
jgi:hypothetical protein